MRLFLKTLMWVMNILNIALCAVTSAAFVWYVLPAARISKLGINLLSVISEQSIFWISLVCGIFFIIFNIINLLLNPYMKSKTKNFFIHTNSWLWCIITALLTVIVFVMINPITTEGISIGASKKVAIGITMSLLLVFHLFAGKISRIINRRIQSYENAKEMGVVGRSSIVWVNSLKLIELIFPEILILILLCLMVSWDVAAYFAILIIAFVTPMIGNIVADLNTRKAIEKSNKRKERKTINKIADKVRDNIEEI